MTVAFSGPPSGPQRLLHHSLGLNSFDLRAVLALGREFTVVYIDVSGLSGFRSVLDVLALLNSYSALLALRVVVVKSGALVNLAHRLVARP